MLLIELVIVILFFALSQVVLVQVFAEAQRKTINSGKLNDSLLYMQDVAELLSDNPDPDTMLMTLGFSGRDGVYVYSNKEGIDFYANIQRLSQPSGQLLTVELSVKKANEVLFTLPSVRYFPTEVQHE